MDRELVVELSKKYSMGTAQTVAYIATYTEEWEKARQRVRKSGKDLKGILIMPRDARLKKR